MKLKYLNIIIIAIDLIVLLSFIFPIFLSFDFTDAGAIGIIGGADGPTAIFVTGKLLSRLPHAILFIANIVIIILNIARKIRK